MWTAKLDEFKTRREKISSLSIKSWFCDGYGFCCALISACSQARGELRRWPSARRCPECPRFRNTTQSDKITQFNQLGLRRVLDGEFIEGIIERQQFVIFDFSSNIHFLNVHALLAAAVALRLL